MVVTVAGRTIADSRSALTLREAAYAAVQYIPRADVDMSLLKRSTTSTYCPYKGDAAYFSIEVGEHIRPDAVWTYEGAYAAVAEISDYLSFYPDCVDSIDIEHVR